MNNKDDALEILREKTEEADFDLYLKKSFGGYTKSSVQEYLTDLHRREQFMANAFNRNLQELLREKESLQEANTLLSLKLSRYEAEHANLFEEILSNDMEGDDPQSTMTLKNTVAIMEDTLRKAAEEKHELQNRIARLTEESELQKRLAEQSRQEACLQKDMLISERAELRKQRILVAGLSRTAEEYLADVNRMKALVAESNIAALNNTIEELTARIASQEELLMLLREENAAKDARIETLKEQNAGLAQTNMSLAKACESSDIQIKKLAEANQGLAERLRDEFMVSLKLISEKSELAVEKLQMKKNLDEEVSKRLLLEMDKSREKKEEPAGEAEKSLLEK